MPRNDDPRNDDPLVFSAGDVIKLLDSCFPHGKRPAAVREFVTALERARQARNEEIARATGEFNEVTARATAEFDEEFLRLLGTDDETPEEGDGGHD